MWYVIEVDGVHKYGL